MEAGHEHGQGPGTLHPRLTVVVTTSPVPSNPSTAMIEALFQSFDLCPGLSQCRKIVVCDGFSVGAKAKYRSGQVTEKSATAYRDYCDALKQLASPGQQRATLNGILGAVAAAASGGAAAAASSAEEDAAATTLHAPPPCETGASEEGTPKAAAEAVAETPSAWADTSVIRLSERVGFAHASYVGLRQVETEFVIVVQHDLAFTRAAELGPLCDTLATHIGVVNYITLPGAKHIGVQHHIFAKYGIKVDRTEAFGVPLVPVIYWYDKTHICRTEWYRQFVFEGGSGIAIPRGQFTEHELGFAERADIVANGMAAHNKYGTYQLDDGVGLPMIEHMNGRRFMTAEQREAQGWPADRPEKVLRQKGRGPGHEETTTTPSSAAVAIDDESVRIPRRRFVLMLRGGLANRLRTVLGFRLVASLCDAELLVCWKPSPACPGHFLDVFEPIAGVSFIDEDETTALIRTVRASDSDQCNDKADGPGTPVRGGSVGVAVNLGDGDASVDVEPSIPAQSNTVVFSGQATIKTILQRYLPKDRGESTTKIGRGLLEVDKGRAEAQHVARLYSLLRPVAHLQDEIAQFDAAHALNTCIGLHIRRTDHSNMAQANGRFTSDDEFLDRMRVERKDNPTVRFFLATDNPTTQRQFESHPEFAGGMFTAGAIEPLKLDAAANARHTELDRAVLDVYILSMCAKVHGSGYSSFSELAHHINTAAAAYKVIAQTIDETSDEILQSTTSGAS